MSDRAGMPREFDADRSREPAEHGHWAHNLAGDPYGMHWVPAREPEPIREPFYADPPEYGERDELTAADFEDERGGLGDAAELDYWSKFCDPCGSSPCTWDGQPDGFHAGADMTEAARAGEPFAVRVSRDGELRIVPPEAGQ